MASDKRLMRYPFERHDEVCTLRWSSSQLNCQLRGPPPEQLYLGRIHPLLLVGHVLLLLVQMLVSPYVHFVLIFSPYTNYLVDVGVDAQLEGVPKLPRLLV